MTLKAVAPICLGFCSQDRCSWRVGRCCRTATTAHRCLQKRAGWLVSHPLSGMLRRGSELSPWGLISQKQCQIEQKAKTHRGAGCACYRLCKQRSTQQDNCGRVTQPGSTSYHLGRNYNGWLRRREGGRLKFCHSLLPQRVLLRRDQMPSAPLFHSFECLSLSLQTTC